MLLIEYYSPLSFLFFCFLVFLLSGQKLIVGLNVLGGPVDTSFPFFARRFKFFPIRSPHAREKRRSDSSKREQTALDREREDLSERISRVYR